ncbi:hypothetical protein SEPCBS119000_005102, partial [Sporothrix epigloea]
IDERVVTWGPRSEPGPKLERGWVYGRWTEGNGGPVLRVYSEGLGQERPGLGYGLEKEPERPCQVAPPLRRRCAWWLSVEGYFNVLGRAYTNSAKIFYIGSILTGYALEWHQTRVRKFKDLNAADSFSSYAKAMEDWFYDPSEPSKNFKRLLKLRYEGSTNTHTKRFQEFNSLVGLSGIALKDIIRAAIPREISNLTFSYLKKGDTSDDGFIEAVNHAGQHYETMTGNADYLQNIVKPPSRQQSSRSHSYGSNNPSAMQPSKDVSSSRSKPPWPNRAAAFNGVDKSDVECYRDASAMCIRCGRTNHRFIDCFANKNGDGKSNGIWMTAA